MRAAGLAIVIALALSAAASAEVVAPGVRDGMLAVAPNGTPLVAYLRGSSLQIATRVAPGRWRTTRAQAVAAGSTLVGFAAGPAGAGAPVRGRDQRVLGLLPPPAGG